MIQSKAAVARGDGTFAIESVRLCEPNRGELLVAIKASDVCHTDRNSRLRGRRIIRRHEGAGEVVRVGEGVTPVDPGARVVRDWAIPFGVCFQCARGKEKLRGSRVGAGYPLPSCRRSEQRRIFTWHHGDTRCSSQGGGTAAQ